MDTETYRTPDSAAGHSHGVASETKPSKSQPMPTDDGAATAVVDQPSTSAEPWERVVIPAGYQLSREGVFTRDEKNPDRITRLSGPIWIIARTRDVDNQNWGVLTQLLDCDGKLHELAIPMERFHEHRLTLVQDLAANGLMIVPGKERPLVHYLAAFEPVQRALGDQPGGKRIN